MIDLGQRDTTLVIELRESSAISFGVREPLPHAMRRITVGLLGRALSDLQPGNGQSFDAGVHQARKKMKRVRGLIRLVRDEVGYSTYRAENVVLRDTARTIGGVRDAWVLLDIMRGLRERSRDLIGTEAFAATEHWLVRSYDEQRTAVTEQVRMNAVVNLAAARSRFGSFPFEAATRDDFAAIAPGLERVYRRGRRARRKSASTGSVEDLHEWRKRVKYLRYQMEALEPLQPRFIGPLARDLDDLGEFLGHDHDLANLGDVVREEPAACRDEHQRLLLVSLITERRELLQALAHHRGATLYAEKPSEFVDRIGSHWEAAGR